MRKHGLKLLVLVMMVLSLSLGMLFAQPLPETHNLTILATTDLHSNVWGFSYENDKESSNDGMARIASYIAEVRAEQPHVILVDNGDVLQGNIMTDDIYNKQDGPHPVIRAMNLLEYDSLTLGNHEFNFGENLIRRVQKLADFPVLSANMARVDGTMATLPYTIVERGGLTIGIIGLTNPNAPRWDGDKTDPFVFAAVGPACRRVVDILKDKVDILIAVAHVGIYPEYDEEGGSDGGNKILELCPELDVLIVGHAHNTYKNIHGDTVVGGLGTLVRRSSA